MIIIVLDEVKTRLGLRKLTHKHIGVLVDGPNILRKEFNVNLFDMKGKLEPYGQVKIGSGCLIGPGAVIRDAKIGSGVEVRAYSVLEECQVGDQARVGPFARLRPQALLEEKAQVGNFVEMKKSTLGKGSKANHLSYLGDTVIGEQANVGAGTITCNYDGVNKHQTVIEDGVFIGSDTQLVAPVKVGKNAVIGAGTTVTVDVPEDALAVSRVKQKNLKGYARRRRKPNKCS